jgi:hypothetical protein
MIITVTLKLWQRLGRTLKMLVFAQQFSQANRGWEHYPFYEKGISVRLYSDT